MEKMRFFPLRYTPSGHVVLLPGDRPFQVVNTLIKMDYPEEFCLSPSFDPRFITELMAAGFLVMSEKIEDPAAGEDSGEGLLVRKHPPFRYILLPKYHLERAVLFFPDLHVGKTLKRLLSRYELRAGIEFDRILNRCAEVHGKDWLTPPLQETLRVIGGLKDTGVRLYSFGLYREGILRAGEFGVVCGGVYTSYSGYYDENSAGMVQMILTGGYLRDRGFAFWDLGMPLAYKERLGARLLDRGRFTELFRKAAAISPALG
ncbi:MAG: leucyl-tRNA--protein transferase [Treponema sp.]|nr:leucyl-tRNA--protein transferase [Treponema sp.]